MPQPKTNPDQYSNQGWLSASTSTGDAVDLGFNCRYLRMENLGGDEVYINLGSTVATTDDYPLSTGDAIEVQAGVPIRDIAVSRNTTTTDMSGTKILGLSG